MMSDRNGKRDRYAQAYVTKRDRKSEVAESIRAIFDAENRVEAERLLKQVVAKYEADMPQLSRWMADNIEEGLTIFNFLVHHRKKLRTSNIAERVNQEIRRRSRVVRIFPNVASCERLAGAIVIEISEHWLSGNMYLSME
jgi:transposase-like protein